MHILSVTLAAFFAFFEVVKCGDNLHSSPWSKRHNSRADVVAQQNITNLEKRFDGARFTFYDAGLGACGAVNAPTDFIVALNALQFDGGKHCFQTITITVDGKSTQATITDMCTGCPDGGLDFTTSLFQFFGSESLGVLTGSWVFGGVASPSPSPSPTPTPTPTPTSTSIYQPPSSSISSLTPISNSTSSQTPTSTQSHTSSAGTSSSISPTPTPLIPPQDAGNIANLFLMFMQVGSLAMHAHVD